MTVYCLPATDPAENLAAEDRIFRGAETCALLWRNTPCVILGRNQSAESEVSLWGRRNIPIFWRKTGGGAVYQDLDNINFSFFYTQPMPREMRESVQPVADFLRLHGLPVVFSGRNDLLLGGKKISGCAMRHSGDRTLVHGTLLFRRDADAMEKILTPDADKLRRHGVVSVRARTGELAPVLPQYADAEQFMLALGGYLRNFGETKQEGSR